MSWSYFLFIFILMYPPQLLLKTYGHVYYWSIPDQNYEAHIQTYPEAQPYHPERQGEAVCWKADNSGYYTLSEGANSVLYFHRRIWLFTSFSPKSCRSYLDILARTITLDMLKKLKSMLILSLLKIIKRKTPLYFLSKHIFCIVLQIQCAYYLTQLQKDCIMLVCKFNKIK